MEVSPLNIPMKKDVFFRVISLVLVLGLNLYFRSFTINFPQLRQQARNEIEQKTHQRVSAYINKKFPRRDNLAKKKLIKQRLASFRKRNRVRLNKLIDKRYLELKDKYQDENGTTYLMELDCWHWARYTENVLRLGHPGDTTKNGRQWDNLMLAPQGAGVGNPFLFYLSAFLYKIFSYFWPTPLFTFLFYLPLFFTAVFITVLYFFTLRWGNLCALISSLFVGLAPIFLPRNSAGWFDTDILNLLLPLLVVWMYILAYDTQNRKKRIFWIVLSGFWVGLFSYAWIGWWFIFLIVITSQFYNKERLLYLGLFLGASLFWIIVFSGTGPLFSLFRQVREALTLNSPQLVSVWPNTFATVSEFRKASLLQIIDVTGGVYLAIPAFFCLLNLLLDVLRKAKKETPGEQTGIILAVWFCFMFFASYKGGIRFAMFLLLPLGISLGRIMNEAYAFFRENRKNLGVWLILLISSGFIVNFALNGYKAASKIFPLMDDTWHRMLSALKEKTPEDAVINSWWDYGDWFKAVSRRRVIFDGHSQNTPQAHWVARVLLANDEEEAVNILRMLNNGGNQGFEIINAQLQNPYQSSFLLNRALRREPQAIAALPAQVHKFLSLKPAKAYFIVDYSMLSMMQSISFLGNWDFQGEAKRLVLPATSKFYTGLLKGQDKGEVALFEKGLVYIPHKGEIYAYSQEGGDFLKPQSLFILKDGELQETIFSRSQLEYSILVLPAKEGYQAIKLSPALAKSLFVRLYFLNAAGLRHFKPFLEEKTGEGYIRVFEIIWD